MYVNRNSKHMRTPKRAEAVFPALRWWRKMRGGKNVAELKTSKKQRALFFIP